MMTNVSGSPSSPDAPRVNAFAEIVAAGFWIRAVAQMTDTAIYGFLAFLVSLPVSAVMLAGGYVPGRRFYVVSPANLIETLMFAALDAAFVSSVWQATPGKRLMGVVVTNEAGQRLGFGHAFLRYVAKLFSAAILCLGYLMAAFTAEKIALHDLLCSTRVIHGKK